MYKKCIIKAVHCSSAHKSLFCGSAEDEVSSGWSRLWHGLVGCEEGRLTGLWKTCTTEILAPLKQLNCVCVWVTSCWLCICSGSTTLTRKSYPSWYSALLKKTVSVASHSCRLNNNNNNNNNNVRLLNCWHTAQLTILTSAVQGGKQQPPRRAALYTEGLSRLNRCHTRRTAIESTAPA